MIVRVIHYDGEFAAIARHMAAHLIEDALAPFLAEQRETATQEGFGAYFKDATMRCISLLSVDSHPVGASHGYPASLRDSGSVAWAQTWLGP